MPHVDAELKDALNAYLRRHHADICRHWFDEIEPLEIDGGVLRLLVTEPVRLRYLQRSCIQPFTEAAQAATGRLLAVRFVGTDGADDRKSGGVQSSRDAVPGDPLPAGRAQAGWGRCRHGRCRRKARRAAGTSSGSPAFPG